MVTGGCPLASKTRTSTYHFLLNPEMSVPRASPVHEIIRIYQNQIRQWSLTVFKHFGGSILFKRYLARDFARFVMYNRFALMEARASNSLIYLLMSQHVSHQVGNLAFLHFGEVPRWQISEQLGDWFHMFSLESWLTKKTGHNDWKPLKTTDSLSMPFTSFASNDSEVVQGECHCQRENTTCFAIFHKGYRTLQPR